MEPTTICQDGQVFEEIGEELRQEGSKAVIFFEYYDDILRRKIKELISFKSMVISTKNFFFVNA